MKLYETTFIVNPQVDDATLDRQVRAVSDLINSNGGKVVAEDRIGTRRLAYQIGGLAQGYYTCIVFEAPPGLPAVLDRHYKLEEPYIRHLTVLYEGGLDSLKEKRVASAADTVEKPEAAAKVPVSEGKPAGTDDQASEAPLPAAIEEPAADASVSDPVPAETPEGRGAEKGAAEASPPEPEVSSFDDEDEL